MEKELTRSFCLGINAGIIQCLHLETWTFCYIFICYVLLELGYGFSTLNKRQDERVNCQSIS